MQLKLRLFVAKYSKVLICCFLVFSFLQTQAQTERTTYSGTVTDQDGKPIVGASVTTKDQRYGTKTDDEGKYSFSVPKTTSRNLVFSSVGFRPTEVRTGANTVFNVKLVKSNEDLDAVTVVGYGTKKKADLSGAVTEVGSEFITNQAITSVDQGLAGLVPGVTLREGTGAPGAGPEILIRGINTFGDNKPLIVIDDVIFEDGNDQLNNPLALINPEDIASLVVLKDAASKAIYGSRATAGVILITTKKGYNGKAKISFSHNISFANTMPFEKPDVLNAEELAQFRKEKITDDLRLLSTNPMFAPYRNDFTLPVPDNILVQYNAGAANVLNPSQYGKGTDWFNEVTQQAITNNSNISISGGNQNLKYFLSGNYLNQDGIVKFNGIRRYSLRGSMDAKISDKIKLGFMFNPSRTDADRPADEPSNSQFSAYSTITSTYWLDPSVPVFQQNGSGLYNYTTQGRLTSNWTANPLYQLSAENEKRRTTQIITSAFIEIEPFKNLTLKSAINYSYNQAIGSNFQPTNLVGDGSLTPVFPNADSGRAVTSNQAQNNFINDNIIRYKIKRKRHDLSVMTAFTVQQNTNEGSVISAKKILDENFILPTSNNVSLSTTISGGGNLTATSNYGRTRVLSQLARINYSFGDKYLVDFSIRRDGSSKFGENSRYGVFPAGSIAWRITEENFMQGLKKSWLNELRFEAGYGITGNSRGPNFGPYTSQGQVSTANYVFGNQVTLGNTLTSVPNPVITWEQAKQLDLGMNASLFKRRLNLSFNWYVQRTSDAIAQTSASFITGAGSFINNQPNSIIENKGFEATFDYAIKRTRNFRWTVGANISQYRNLLVDYFNQNGFLNGNAGNGTQVAISKPGERLGMYRGLKILGLYTAADIADPKVPKYAGARVGGTKYLDGNGDGVLNGDVTRDYVILGNPHPDFSFGFNTMVQFKGVTIRAIFAGQKGGLIYDLRREIMWNVEGNFNIERQVLERWRPGDDPSTKSIGSSSFNQNLYRIPSDNKIYDGSYLALKNLTIGYNLTKAINAKRRIVENLDFTVGLRNVFYLASYKYGNPEVRRANDGSALRGINYGSYPIARTFSLGVNVAF
jgi:TonB-dependent starch-binding outer membrane protein SusC